MAAGGLPWPGRLELEVTGFAVLTQSCDIVRKRSDRPFVTVAPLVEVVDAKELLLVERGYRPQYASIPGVAQKRLVADLDRAMTIDKGVVAKWSRVRGCTTDAQTRAFAKAISRKHARFAFPDDFTAFVKRLQERMKEKHGKASGEGQALERLSEIRVHATPSWDAPQVDIMFWFICPEEDIAEIRRGEMLDAWLKLVPDSGRFKTSGAIVTLEDLKGTDYVESDPLDLDHLSG